MKHFNNILYVLDDHTHKSSVSLMRAIALAKSNQADLTLLQILPDAASFIQPYDHGSISTETLPHKMQQQEKAKLQTLIDSLDVDFSLKAEQRTGKPYVEIIRLVQAQDFDLVIKEIDDIDWLDRLLGSDDMHLLRKCPCPVWLMKQDADPQYKHIMAAVDLTDTTDTANDELNSEILEFAYSLSLADFTTLHVVNAYDVPQAGFISLWAEQADIVKEELFAAEGRQKQHKIKVLMDDLKSKIGAQSYDYLSPQTHITQGPPGREIPKLANELNADLVVMGTIARTGIAGVVIGNTAENVLPQLRCSVLAIKPKGFVSPIT
ncbi:universal stress protein [Amphritea sp. 2_MG-2023]|uniref:universal stress protein n=1 Tax=Amphritea TaxID=515417 RepID=UPI001C07AE36|nr:MULTISPECIES: universal stress protein [Amphritea]MBU2965085.1 universal stress protein [Amphritea atlantica]MDO6418870.1 universal stress protein [Amphritea sp. 2_MG-2023]